MPMVVSVTKNLSRDSYLRLSFHPKMKPYLLQLKNRFLVYEAKNVLSLPSSYAIRMYELTKQYAPIGKRNIKVEDLKKILGVENKYKQYTHLKQRILEPSVKSVNEHTDIDISYTERKRGRKVHLLEFVIKHKNPITKKEVKSELSYEDKLKKMRGMLYSRPELQRQITNKHGNLSDKAMLAVVQKMFPEKFKAWF